MDPLTGPFLTPVQLCDYSDEPGWAIRLPDPVETGGELARIERQF